MAPLLVDRRIAFSSGGAKVSEVLSLVAVGARVSEVLAVLVGGENGSKSDDIEILGAEDRVGDRSSDTGDKRIVMASSPWNACKVGMLECNRVAVVH